MEGKLPSLPSENKLNEYIVNRKLEVPYYDPQTGELNLDYEKLTGKRNPLQQLRDTELSPVPRPYEPKKKNRFLVTFPETFGLKQWVVRETSRPSMFIREKKFLGITYKKVIEWETISIVLMDPFNPSSTHNVMKLIKDSPFTPFDYRLEMLDPTGVVLETWLIEDCLFESVNFGEVSYKDDGIAIITLMIKPKNVGLMRINKTI